MRVEDQRLARALVIAVADAAGAGGPAAGVATSDPPSQRGPLPDTGPAPARRSGPSSRVPGRPPRRVRRPPPADGLPSPRGRQSCILVHVQRIRWSLPVVCLDTSSLHSDDAPVNNLAVIYIQAPRCRAPCALAHSRTARCAVRGARSEVRGPRCAVRGARSEVRGPRCAVRGAAAVAGSCGKSRNCAGWPTTWRLDRIRGGGGTVNQEFTHA